MARRHGAQHLVIGVREDGAPAPHRSAARAEGALEPVRKLVTAVEPEPEPETLAQGRPRVGQVRADRGADDAITAGPRRRQCPLSPWRRPSRCTSGSLEATEGPPSDS